ncbi:MAG: beta-lactamase-like protein [Mycobacterium sp.]|nr:beta-lactamase-like protein [Mycobacterium sp.]
MKLIPLGVRGSTAAPGAQFVRYGGHTSCVAVLADGDEFPRLILDAGTGLRSLPNLLGDRPFRGDIVLTHLHWDHLQGLPFSPSVDHPESEVTLHVPVDDERTDPRTLLARSFSPPFFPISPDGLLGNWQLRALVPGPLDELASPAAITVAAVSHKGGPTLGVRVELEGRVLAYLPDHALCVGMPESLRRSAELLAADADFLVHDGQFCAAEAARARTYGHATIEAVTEFADQCGVGRLVFTHHAPGRTDDELDRMAASWSQTRQGRPITFARQDRVIG